MKRIYLYTIVLITIYSCTDSDKKSVFASIGYNKDTLTIGQISKGDTAHVGFGFVSTGDVPLKILKVNASCGFAVPHYNL